MDFSSLKLRDNQDLARKIIEEASKNKFKNRHEFEMFRNGIVKKAKGVIFHNLYFIKAYKDLVDEGVIVENKNLLGLIRKRSVRTLSGVAPVTVLTKPYPCPGRCVYCPTDVRMPKSYIASQPAAQRALGQKFDPYTQVIVRLKALNITGHEVSKVELRIIGGTWSSYKKNYQTWFVKRCLMAMNEFVVNVMSKKARKSFDDVVKENEIGKIRCIGINIETRPDFITKNEVKRLRFLGVTKVEMGVQTTSEEVQKITDRGHTLKEVKRATKLLKDAGFKIGYHMMPNLPGTTVNLDKKMIGELFTDEGYQPDYLKIYPCVVVPQSKLFSWYKKGDYKPYDDKTLEEVLLEEMKSVPPWCRVDRIARDIPANEIAAGFKSSNIRQILEERLLRQGIKPRDIRFREIGNEEIDLKNVGLVERGYEASGGKEMFISYEDLTKDKLIALLRLRFPFKAHCGGSVLANSVSEANSQGHPKGCLASSLSGAKSKRPEVFIDVLNGAAIIREIHVYGRQIPVGEKSGGNKQHVGWGRKLMKKAEKIAKKAGYGKIAVIAGIGTREYYKKLGYKLKDTYMIKYL
ncbi:tRNA uridine(34) 5-carboxymethylaminomethyl modification radical SAM/GNAT enzyme Elp3 [Candidatus Peregrinibacteria bacterium]|nr:tRNA uridine(34) 5-carboxymethylaminomethyl modification radical SAM/GNAT enzyme Elp3 [Candidatus Peregrinibacteria bacterium]